MSPFLFQIPVMKAAFVFVCLLVAVAAKPQFGLGFGPFGSATGSAGAGSFQGQTSGPFGNSQIQSSSANAAVSVSFCLPARVDMGSC